MTVTWLNPLDGDDDSLEGLLAIIHAEHSAARDAFQASIRHAVRVGHALLKARTLVPRGEWYEWVHINCPFHPQTARRYMRLATYEELVIGQFNSSKEAIRYLEGLPSITLGGRSGTPYDPAIRDRALQLRRDGVGQREVARLVGVARTTVRRWEDPARAAAETQRRREQKQLESEKKQAASLRQAAKDAGGSVALGYSYLRRSLKAFDKAVGAAEGSTERLALEAVVAALHGAEDAVSAALFEARGSDRAAA